MAWYNSSWLYRQKITVDATQVDEVFSLLPIYTSKLNMHYFDHAKAGAADIRITRADGTTEVARYAVAHDATARTGCIIANVLADVSISTNTDYYVYYGNSAASDYATTDTYGRDAAFGDYAGAYMPGMTTADLTGGGRTLTAVNSPGTAASGLEGITAATYAAASSQYHSYDGTLGVSGWPLTLEGLTYTTSATTNQRTITVCMQAATASTFFHQYAGTVINDPSRATAIGGSGSSTSTAAVNNYTTSAFHSIAVTRDANSGTSWSYIDGASGSNTTTLLTPTAFNRFIIGARKDSSGTSEYLNGRVAVALLSDSVRSADYVSTMQDAWNSSTFWTAGEIETENGGMTGWRLFQTAATTSASGTLVDWSNPNNALSTNVDAATVSLDDGGNYESETLKLTNPDYGITIPSAQDTYECQFRVSRSRSSGASLEINDLNVQFIDNTGALVGTNLADATTDWPVTAATKDYTVAGVSLTDTKFDADSGLAFSATGIDTNGATTASVITGWINVIWESSGATTGGDGALTLPAPLEISGAGSVPVVGTGALSLPALTLSGAGSVLVAGSGNLDLPGIEIIGSGGNAAITGTGNLNLPVIDLAGAGSVVIVGSGNIDIPVIEIDGAETPTTTGWFLFQNATTGAASLPDVKAWTNPEGALDEAGTFAYVAVGVGGVYYTFDSAELVVRNPLGISIPEGSLITSIEYKIDRLTNSPATGDISDYEIRPFKGGVAAGDNIALPGTWDMDTAETVEYGPSLMGLTWGANDFGSDFGLSIVLRAEDLTNSFGFVSMKINAVWGKINYTSSDAITGDGALELPSITLDTPPNPTGGTATLELPLFTMKGHSYNALCSCCEGYTMRTLIELRRMLVQQSGHAELVADYENEDWADNGADHFIQAGQRFCDDQFQYHKSEAWFYAALAAGESLVTFTNARIIKQVWLNYTGGNRVLLERLTLDKMREEYTEPLLSDETQGTPVYWVPAVLGLAPQQYTETALSFDADGITDHNLIMFGNHYPYKGIYIMPPADGDYTIEIKAEWYSHEMCEDSDVSFWSQYPELILMAARRQMEIDLHRNSTGAQDFEAPLMRSLMKLSHNLVAEEWSGPTKVRGEC